jgi:N-acetyl-anhydromuramyl-L-alanine amidase AmpD
VTNSLAIVDHIMCGTFEGCRSWFTNPNSWASSHFGISRDGNIDQYISLLDAAWANGAVNHPDPIAAPVYTGHNPNLVSWSVEHEGWPEDVWTERMYQADLKLKKWLLARKPGLLLLGHCHIDSVTRANCPGPNWPRDRLLADLKGEEEMAITLVRREGKPEVYFVAGGELIHIPSQQIFHLLGYKDEDVKVLPFSSPVFDLPVRYGRVPD